MSAAHTPGPWHAQHDHGWLVVESYNEDLYIKIEKGSAAKKHMANALLIASAPELLEALQDLLNDDAKEYIPSKKLDKARAAIAKATGGAS
jgi:hypothetical protein